MGVVGDGIGLHSCDGEFEVDHFDFDCVEALLEGETVVLLHCAH